MRIRAETRVTDLPPGLRPVLDACRRERGFDVVTYLAAKRQSVTGYLRRHGIATVVVPVSGGVDSAVVAAMFESFGADVVKVNVACLGVPGQAEALDSARAVAGDALVSLTSDAATRDVWAQVDAAFPVPSGSRDWALVQLVNYVRTPMVYAVTSALSARGVRSVVVGTTNRDEGSYLGYVGKAADGMVDLQPITDLHKSEVYALARHLGVPASVVGREPTGDLHDSVTDVEVFGAPYDAVELFLTTLNWDDERRGRMVASLSDEDARDWSSTASNLMALHGYNAHKYLVGSPAVHLDVMRSDVRGGWRRVVPALTYADFLRVVNPVPCPVAAPAHVPARGPETLADGVVAVRGLLAPGECAAVAAIDRWVSADLNGRARPGLPDGQVGSWRASFHDQVLADALTERLALALPPLAFVDGRWRRLVGVAPLFRVIRYEGEGNGLVPHFDAPYVAADGSETTHSLVIYCESPPGSGTRFLRHFGPDDHSDRDRPARDDEVAFQVHAGPGDAVLFPHRTLHDGPPSAGRKVIVRTDVVYGELP